MRSGKSRWFGSLCDQGGLDSLSDLGGFGLILHKD